LGDEAVPPHVPEGSMVPPRVSDFEELSFDPRLATAVPLMDKLPLIAALKEKVLFPDPESARLLNVNPEAAKVCAPAAPTDQTSHFQWSWSHPLKRDFRWDKPYSAR